MNTTITTAHRTCVAGPVRAGLLPALLAVGSVALAGPPASSAPASAPATTPRTGPDLSTPEGAAAARDRLHHAARLLCSRVADTLAPSHPSNYGACVDDALAAAVRQVSATNVPSALKNGVSVHPATVAAGPASPSDQRSARVSLKDLDLHTPEGARAAQQRLHDVARRLCSQLVQPQDLSHYANYNSCVDAATADALRQASFEATLAGRREAPTDAASP